MSMGISRPGDGEKIVGVMIGILSGLLLIVTVIDRIETGVLAPESVFGAIVIGGILSAGSLWYGHRLVRINANKEVSDQVYSKIRDYCQQHPESKKALRAWLQERGRNAIVWSEVQDQETILMEADTRSARGSVLTASVSPKV